MRTRVRHCVVRLCCMLSAVAVLGCAAQQRQSMPTDARAASGVVTMPLYDETVYYNAVKNRWFGLGDYATDQPGR
jgi:outer membrane protein